MAVNLTALAQATTTATALANLVLVTPKQTVGFQPQNPDSPDDGLAVTVLPPPNAFLFAYEGENVLQLESDITDHYVEDNTAIEDNIALKPPLYTVQGFVGELDDVAPGFLQPVKFAADKLTAIGAFAPQLSATALIAYSEALFLYQTAANVANSAVAAWSTVTGQGGESVIDGEGIDLADNQSKQQVALQRLYGYWAERRLFTIQTPWAIFQNMAIHKIRAIQEADTDKVTNFAIDFKLIRKASTLTTGNVSATAQGRLQSQSSGVTNQGTSTPTSSISSTTGMTQMGIV